MERFVTTGTFVRTVVDVVLILLWLARKSAVPGRAAKSKSVSENSAITSPTVFLVLAMHYVKVVSAYLANASLNLQTEMFVWRTINATAVFAGLSRVRRKRTMAKHAWPTVSANRTTVGAQDFFARKDADSLL